MGNVRREDRARIEWNVRRRKRRESGKRGEAGEEMSGVEGIAPEIDAIECRRKRRALEEVGDAVIRRVAARTNVLRLAVDDGEVRVEASAEARAELRQSCAPRTRKERLGAIDGRRTLVESLFERPSRRLTATATAAVWRSGSTSPRE